MRQGFVSGKSHAIKKLRLNISAAKQTIMPNFHKAIWQNMKKKASGKLSSIKSHDLGLKDILIIFPDKANRLTVKRQDSGVTNSDSMSISSKITNNIPWRLKRFFTKDYPIYAI
jgi:hypothetical protein